MIRIRTVKCGNFRYETLEEALNRYLDTNKISDSDIINLIPDRDNPHTELHIYYREKEF